MIEQSLEDADWIFRLPFVPFVLLRCLYARSLRDPCCAWYWPAQGMGAWRLDFRMLSC
ncbi:hypothetical protein Hanom_Chr03g00207911 [Helianthus anomalus]